MKRMIYIGLIIAGIGVILYAISTIGYNSYLRQHKPELLNQHPTPTRYSRHTKKRQASASKVIITESHAPAWIVLIGLPSIPMFVIGIICILITVAIKFFAWVF